MKRMNGYDLRAYLVLASLADCIKYVARGEYENANICFEGLQEHFRAYYQVSANDYLG